MGEAVESVKGNGSKSSPVPRSKTFSEGSILADLTNILDRIDRAKEVKQGDLDEEGRGAMAENHTKLGLLTGAGALVLRARAMLEDYGRDVDEDISAEVNDRPLGDSLKDDHPENQDDCLPFGPEDLPEWCRSLGTKLRDPDDDGPWEVVGIDYKEGRIKVTDIRTNEDGSPFSGGMQRDSITFDDLAPEGDWCPFDCGHTSTTDDGSCADCGVKDVSIRKDTRPTDPSDRHFAPTDDDDLD